MLAAENPVFAHAAPLRFQWRGLDRSRRALYHPERLPAFAESPPSLIPSAAALDFASAWWLAHAAHLSYHDDATVERTLRRIGWEPLSIVDRSGIRAWLGRSATAATLVFCGTRCQHPSNFREDCDARSTPFAGGRVHRGFARALDAVWPGLAPALAGLPATLPLAFSGHSLGAALAVLAACRHQPTAVVGFGGPRIGDAAFARALGGTAIWQVQACCDAVCRLPPEEAGFRRVGRRVFVLDGGRVLVDPRRWTMRRHQLVGALAYARSLPWASRDAVLLRSLVDHSIVNYASALAAVVRRGLPPVPSR